MSDPDPVLYAALADLVQDGTLTPEQAEAVTGAVASRAKAPAERVNAGILVAAYAGFALVVAAVATLLGQRWTEMGTGTRAAITGGLVAVLVGLGALLREKAGGLLDSVCGLLWMVAVFAAGAFGAAFFGVEESEGKVFVVAGLVASVVAVVLYVLRPRNAQLVGVVGAVATTVIAATGELDMDQVPSGVAVVVLGVLVLLVAAARLVDSPALGYVLGGLLVLGGVETVWLDHEALGASLVALVVLAAYADGARRDAAAPFALASAAVAIFGPQMLHEWFGGTLGATMVLLLSGLLVLLVVAWYAYAHRRVASS